MPDYAVDNINTIWYNNVYDGKHRFKLGGYEGSNMRDVNLDNLDPKDQDAVKAEQEAYDKF